MDESAKFDMTLETDSLDVVDREIIRELLEGCGTVDGTAERLKRDPNTAGRGQRWLEPAAAHLKLSQRQLDFLRTVIPPANASQRDTGIPAAVTIAQAILESGWGRSSLFGPPINNPFGIKFSHRQRAEGYGEFDAKTRELVDGDLVAKKAAFQAFPDLAEAFRAHAILLSTNQRYERSMQVRDNWRKFAVQLMFDGYSTDRPGLCADPHCIHYGGKLIRIIEDYRLDDVMAMAFYVIGKQPESSRPAAG
jgi:flagellum-specific peptidoglycan hydrolase FlgJ